MITTVQLKKTGYDPFITFMKGYAILCVLLAHALPNPDATGYALWGGMQVPLFLLIQVFHAFKKDPYFSFTKLMKRAVMPFLLIQLVLIALACRHDNAYNQLIISVIRGGARAWCLLFLGLLAVCSLTTITLSTDEKTQKKSTANHFPAGFRGLRGVEFTNPHP